MDNFLVAVVNYNVPVIILLLAFIVGFISKIAACYVYDSELENAVGASGEMEGINAEIVNAYIEKRNHGVNIKNTKAFVDNILNGWKKFGISISKVEGIGDMCGYIAVAVSAFFDMALLTEKAEIGNRLNVMMCVYVYTALAVIFFAVLKLWEGVVASKHKKELLADAMTDYLDNRFDFEQSRVNISEVRQDRLNENIVNVNTSKENESNENKSKQNASKENASKENALKENALKEDASNENKSKQNTINENKSNKNRLNGNNLYHNQPNEKNKTNKDTLQARENVITQVLDEYLTS